MISNRLLGDSDFARAAKRLMCEVAAIRAVAEVEAGPGTGFLKNGKPKILFESRYFHRLTGGKFTDSHQHISTSKWVRNYKGGEAEYERLEEAHGLDSSAALKSASWGKFQIMGANFKVAGYASVEDFVRGMYGDEGRHLDAFVGFVQGNRLDDELRDRRWADFARGYNGPGFKKNRYDDKMAEAYARLLGGLKGRAGTVDIQSALVKLGYDLVADGMTGPKTRAAVRHFQQKKGLVADGIASLKTLRALGLGSEQLDDPALPVDSLEAVQDELESVRLTFSRVGAVTLNNEEARRLRDSLDRSTIG